MSKVNANQILKQKFGFDTFHPGQAETIQALQAGKSVLSVLPTGAGKSLIYQIYSYLVNKPVVVVSPLLSLMNDQVERIRYQGLGKVVALNSEYDWKDRRTLLQNISHFRYIFLSPEMLNQPEVLKGLKTLEIGLFVVDEAHCISKWGVDFRPDYLNLASNLNKLGRPQTLMLTATASKKVQTDIIEKLAITNYECVTESVNRSNIFLGVHKTATELDKQTYLLEVVSQLKGPGIIYFSSKKMANLMADMINDETKAKAAPYHADLSKEDRFKIQHQFMDNELNVICATNAFGMGIDKSDIKFVIHYHLPQDLESYMQEIGRAGRSGQPSLAILLYCTGDEQITQNLIENSLPTETDYQKYKQHKFNFMDDQIKRLLDFYYQKGYSEQQIKAIFKEDVVIKRSELEKMLVYVNYEECRRKFLLANFDETFNAHNQFCCNIGTDLIDLKPYESFISNSDNSKKSDWKIIINQLF